MYENDYILRVVRQMTEVIAKLLFNREIKNYDFCHEITDTALKENFGISKELLLKLPTTAIMELLGSEANSEAISLLSQLLKNEGDVFQDEGNLTEANRCYLKSAELLDALG